jgi:glutamate formiminotransferase/formiminotetrahydrofolate cyclodeaminase
MDELEVTMQQAMVECVPNFSEGRNTQLIKQITDMIESVKEIRLLNVDPGPDMNRTVVTFVGSPPAVKEAAFLAIREAAKLIDMSMHHGSHPRMGATDVCPFVPVSGISIEECVELSREVARRVGNELNIPVYLYEKSATNPERQNLAIVRQGEYEGLAEKLKDPRWKPDFGPTEFNVRSGATVIGVREFLIAYNINLNTREVRYATDIAYELREKGRSVRKGSITPFYFKGEEVAKYAAGNYACGSCDFISAEITGLIAHCREAHGYDLKQLWKLNNVAPENPEGKSVVKPGKFRQCKAIGWLAPKYDRAQISINLTDYKVTSMHDVMEETRRLVAQRGLVVTGSEVVGMAPFPALLESGKFYLRKQGRSVGVPVSDILNTAAQSLGLADVAGFSIEERALGLPKTPGNALIAMKVEAFTDEVSRESPAPGGGSIAALSGALGAALSSMVSNLTANKRGSEIVDEILNAAAEKAQHIKLNLLQAVDADTQAFNAYMEARRLPAKTEEEKKIKFSAEQNGLKEAVCVPLNTARQSYEALQVAEIVVKHGNPNSITDVGVGAQMAYSGVLGGIYNVLINLKNIDDAAYIAEMKATCTDLKTKALTSLTAVLSLVEAKIS